MNITRIFKNSLGTAMLAGALMLAPQAAQARVFVSVGIAPPLIPVYEQPLCPGDGYIWTPGYWAYGDQGYYWVEGAWVLAPYEGALWTPGFWGWGGGVYFWNPGYWGRTVGYYGGINYGFGYFGTGFYGGYWNRGHFFYNRGYNHINVTNIHNVYNRPVSGINNPHAGGNSFVHTSDTFAAAHGAGINGHVNTAYGVRTTSSNPGYNDRTNTTAAHGFAQPGGNQPNGGQPGVGQFNRGQPHSNVATPHSFSTAPQGYQGYASTSHASAPSSASAPHGSYGGAGGNFGGGHPSGGGGHPGGGGGGGHSGGGHR